MQNRAADGPATSVVIGIVLGVIVALIPICLLLGLVILYTTAGVYHVCVLLVGGRGSFEATFRAVAYSTGAGWWNIVCCVAQMVFQTIGLTHAFAHAHNISKTRACIAALIPQVLQMLAIAAPYAIMIITAVARAR
jgi:hypothetical protein